MEHTARGETQGTDYNKTCAHITFNPGLVSFREKSGAMENLDTVNEKNKHFQF